MPRLNLQGKSTLGIDAQKISYDGNILTWTSHPLHAALVDTQPIIGGTTAWLDNSTLVFQSGQSATSDNDSASRRIYTYNIYGNVITSVSASGADDLYAGWGIWAAWLSGSGYRDSLGRTNADYGVVGVDRHTGTVLVSLNKATGKGLGYLTTDDAAASDVHVITHDTFQTAGTIGRDVVIYKAFNEWHAYNIRTLAPSVLIGKRRTTDAPVNIIRNDGYYVVAYHPVRKTLVVFQFGDRYGWKFGSRDTDINPDICILPDNSIRVVTSVYAREAPEDLQTYTIDRQGGRIDLYNTKPEEYIFLPPVQYPAGIRYDVQLQPQGAITTGRTVIGTDIVSVGRNPNGVEAATAKLIISDDFFGSANGEFIRGAWQYDVTAVIARTGNTCNSEVEVKDSAGHSWCAGESSYGDHPCAIRPAPTSNSTVNLWEVTWVQAPAGASYGRATLNGNLVIVGSATTTALEFGSQGMLDLSPNTAGIPIVTASNLSDWYGYVHIGLATTRGDWTIGQDMEHANDRLIAWDADAEQAYVVWNGTTTVQSRLALEYDDDENPTPVVNPASQELAIRLSQFIPIEQQAYIRGDNPLIIDPIASDSDIIEIPLPQIFPMSSEALAVDDLEALATAIASTRTMTPLTRATAVALSPETLTTGARVFRQYQTIPPTVAVLNAFNPKSGAASGASTTTGGGSGSSGAGASGFLAAAGAATATIGTIAALKSAIKKNGQLAATTVGAGSGSIEEEAPSYNPTYPYNTVLHESESGHLIEVDDSPGAERIHIFHRSGSHIEMRPDGGVKYKAVKKRQDITIGDNEVMISGDCNITVEGGYTLHVRKGELIIDAKDDAAINVKGNLKISADKIEMKASKKIFLNAPKVDIGGVSPGGMPMMSLPGGVTINDRYPLDPTFVPRVKLPLTGVGMAKLKRKLDKPDTRFSAVPTHLQAATKSKSLINGTVVGFVAGYWPSVIFNIAAISSLIKGVTSIYNGLRARPPSPTDAEITAAIKAALREDAIDASGEPAFSTLKEQPDELPLSHFPLYGAAQVLEAGRRVGAASTSKTSQQLRGRAFDTPEDVENVESYNAHIRLSVELGDFAVGEKDGPGTILRSDTTAPTKEPLPPKARSLPSGGTVQYTTGTKSLQGTGTKFTEDISGGDTLLLDGINIVVESIASDTTLNLTQPWPGTSGSGVVEVYRLRPFKEFFGTFIYSDSTALGTSGLTLGDMMVNFTSPVIEVPQINAAMLTVGLCGDGAGQLTSGTSGGTSGRVTSTFTDANDDIDPKTINWLHTNVSDWEVTSKITEVRIASHEFCIYHTAAGQWPTTTSVFDDEAPIEGNAWIFGFVNGQWYGATWDWLRPGQQCKSMTAEEFGSDQIRIPPLDSSWVPQPGESIGVMMSTVARRGSVDGQEQRSNIKLVTMP